MRVHAAVAGRHTRHGQLLPLEVYLEEGVPLVRSDERRAGQGRCRGAPAGACCACSLRPPPTAHPRVSFLPSFLPPHGAACAPVPLCHVAVRQPTPPSMQLLLRDPPAFPNQPCRCCTCGTTALPRCASCVSSRCTRSSHARRSPARPLPSRWAGWLAPGCLAGWLAGCMGVRAASFDSCYVRLLLAYECRRLPHARCPTGGPQVSCDLRRELDACGRTEQRQRPTLPV